MRNIFKVFLLCFSFFIICSFKNPSEETVKKIITSVFEFERLSKISNNSPSSDHLYTNDELKESLYYKDKFNRQWDEKLGCNILKYDQKLIFDHIEKINNFYKVLFRRNLELESSLFPSIIQKSFDEKYVALLSYNNNSYILEALVYQEERPQDYEDLANFTDGYRSVDFPQYITDWKDKLEKIDDLYKTYRALTEENITTNYNRPITTNFNRELAAAYAQKYALNYNPEYKDFSDSGGDCTNFVSQCLAAGGLKKTSTWKPYTNAWNYVQHLRDYLIYNNLATEYNQMSPRPVGSVVQFFNPQKNSWAHSGVITYKTTNDYLYCCHTYNKLNYALSNVYPVIYHKIRVLEIN